MKNLISTLMKAVRFYTVLDFAVLKIYLLCIGILLGSYFGSFFMKYVSVIWVVVVLAFVFILIQIVKYIRMTKD